MRAHRTLVAIAATAALTLSGCASDEETTTDTAPGIDATTEVGATPEDGAEFGDGEFNDADIAFAQGMIVHHEQAIEMSDIILGKDNIDERVTALAEDIKAAQEPEIELLSEWLAQWGAEDNHAAHADDDMHGMMSDEDLEELRAAEGTEAARLFLEQMIIHHEGALAMSDTLLAFGSNPDAHELAEEILYAQETEIDYMKELLETL
ncbi:DUF305 domain-containing protein [Hoyosella rhizosphaerae]|uniref:DUF305 domain-containing protein n=1 Tax=Hoyosella rhizosphaerae TaxID=1755582 RepID=A0A916XAD7_9ACTN|nr:DUF305 domain-containing protein [Hoyosella rhizosphaerae]MBN4926714.1 DUF305 domain-containing protein [Hoyosella rhizosphaerae]GGC56996.1 DUF305 domain-containing protein [Hoyosella rhizosphaerae]